MLSRQKKRVYLLKSIVKLIAKLLSRSSWKPARLDQGKSYHYVTRCKYESSVISRVSPIDPRGVRWKYKAKNVATFKWLLMTYKMLPGVVSSEATWWRGQTIWSSDIRFDRRSHRRNALNNCRLEKIKSDIQVICFLREIHRVPWLRYLYFRNVNGAYSGSRNISY